MTSSNDILSADATQQSSYLRSKHISPSELLDEAIKAVERVNPKLNSLIHERFDAARTEAKTVDLNAPFGGVPMVVKDLECAIAGEPHHMGARFLKNAGYRAPNDSYLAERFRRGGFVIIGRTNTPEFGGTITTEPLAYGPCRNPWNTNHSTGGSSGGSAATVASGCVAVGHANDGGGSIRVPASECGLVGLKPSRGRVSKGPDIGESWMGSTIDGCVTRSVRDTAAVLDLISGYESGDPYTAPPFARPLAKEVGVNPGALRIGILDHPVLTGGIDHPETRASIAETAKLLTTLGHHVEIAHPPALGEQSFSDMFTIVVCAAMASDISIWEKYFGRTLGADDIEPDTSFMAEMGRTVSVCDYLRTVGELHRWSRRVIEWWLPRDGSRGFDLLCTPTIAGPPPPIGLLAGPEGMQHAIAAMQYTAQFNVTGQPAISLPLHWSASGLPMGVQFVGAPYREDILVQVAAQLESATNWSQRRPLVHA